MTSAPIVEGGFVLTSNAVAAAALAIVWTSIRLSSLKMHKNSSVLMKDYGG
jgi:hypothetical protein